MKNPISLFKLMMALLLVSLLVACGGGGGSSTDEPDPGDDDPTPEEPEDPNADVAEPLITGLTSGDGSITIEFIHALESEDDPPEITYDFYYALEKFEVDEDEEGNFVEEDMSLAELEERFSSRVGATLLEAVESPLVLTGLENDTFYYFVITATTEADGSSNPSNEFRATPRDYSASTVTAYVLNDTGKTACGDYAFDIDVNGNGQFNDNVDTDNSGRSNNQIDCVNGETDPDGDTLPEPAAQDAYIGRDYLAETSGLAKTGAGLAGFDFTRLDASGNALPEDASEWDCVQDNHTGLVWEVKTTGGLHNAADRYSWYNDDELSNGGIAGYQRARQLSSSFSNDTCFGYEGGNSSTYCNSSAYVDRVNTAGLCGASDWRLPTREELIGIVNYELENIGGNSPEHLPSLDPDYFPNIQISTIEDTVRYLTSDPYASSAVAIWGVYMGSGGSAAINKAEPNAIMLVREP